MLTYQKQPTVVCSLATSSGVDNKNKHESGYWQGAICPYNAPVGPFDVMHRRLRFRHASNRRLQRFSRVTRVEGLHRGHKYTVDGYIRLYPTTQRRVS